MLSRLKASARKNRFLYKINTIYKAWRSEHDYRKRCKKYGTPGLHIRTSKTVWPAYSELPNNGSRLKVAFCSSAKDQDNSGLLQSLKKFADIELFSADEVAKLLTQQGRVNSRELQQFVSNKFIEFYRGIKKADLVIGQFHQMFISAKTLKKIKEEGVRTINICMDDRFQFDRKNKVGSPYLFGAISGTTTTCLDAVSWYLQEDEKVLYWPEASNPDFFYPRDKRDIDVVFVGSRYGIRERIVNKLRHSGISVQAFGSGWENGLASPEKVSELFGRAKIVLGIGCIEHSSTLRIIKLRDFDGPMSGACYVTTYTPDLLYFYDINKEIVCYNNDEECVKTIKRLLNNNEERENIAKAGLKKAQNLHSWDKRWESLLDWARLL